jgi:hypothetical protein
VNDHLDEQITERASASYEAIRALNHDTINQLNMTPSGVSRTVANHAVMAAALPQACAQLSRILARANDDHVLTMDSLVDETDAGMAIGQAEIHLDEARELASGCTGISMPPTRSLPTSSVTARKWWNHDDCDTGADRRHGPNRADLPRLRCRQRSDADRAPLRG